MGNIAFMSVFPPYRGGIARFSDHLFHALSARHNCHAIGYRRLYPPLLFPGSSPFEKEPRQNYADRCVHAYHPGSWRSTVRRIARLEPDLLLYSHWHPFTAVSTRRIIRGVQAQRPGVRVGGILHNAAPHESFPFSRTLNRRLFQLTDHPVVLSSQVAREFESLTGGRQPVQLFHPVYDRAPKTDSPEAIRRRLGVGDRERVVLYFGLIRPYKGVDLLIEALNGLDLEHWNLRPVIAGEFYTDPSRYLGRIDAQHRPRYLIMDHFLSEQQVAELFRIADVLVLPYRHASQSGVLAHAIQHRVPVIGSDLPGLRDHIEHNRHGLLFPAGNVQALRQSLMHYFTGNRQAGMREEMHERKNRFSWASFTERFLDKVM